MNCFYKLCQEHTALKCLKLFILNVNIKASFTMHQDFDQKLLRFKEALKLAIDRHVRTACIAEYKSESTELFILSNIVQSDQINR